MRLCMSVILLALLSAPLAAQQPQDRPPQIPTLTVYGQGQATAEPDRAVVRLGATAQADQAAAAQQQVNQIVQQAIENIRGLDIPQERITTTGITLQPVYSEDDPPVRERRRPRDPRIVGYRASNLLRIEVQEIPRVGDVIDAAVEAGANRIEGIQFELADETAIREQALRAAAESARAKARTLAEAMNLELVQVQEVIEETVRVMPYEMARTALAESGAPVQPGQVRVDANLTVRYKLAETALREGGDDGQPAEQ